MAQWHTGGYGSLKHRLTPLVCPGAVCVSCAVLSSIPHLAGLSDEDLDPEQPDPATAGYDLPASPRAAATAAGGNGSNGNGAVPAVVYRLPLYLEDWVDQVGLLQWQWLAGSVHMLACNIMLCSFHILFGIFLSMVQGFSPKPWGIFPQVLRGVGRGGGSSTCMCAAETLGCVLG